MFVRFQCGCVGLVLQPRGKFTDAIIVEPCDPPDDSSGVTWFLREVRTDRESPAPLSPEQEEHLHKRLGQRLGLADAYDQLRAALKFAVREDLP